LIGKNFIYCPNDKPHLQYWVNRSIDGSNCGMYATCNNIETESSLILPIKRYKQYAKYLPLEGFETGVNILSRQPGSYKLLSYNKPSTHDRDYYIYLPYEYDPIIKVVYAFCV